MNILKAVLIATVSTTLFTGVGKMENDILSYGAFIKNGETEFRLMAPKADMVFLVIFQKYDDETGTEYPMNKTTKGIWSCFLKNAGIGTLYGYRLKGNYLGNDPNVIVADPYSKAAVTQNSYRHVAKSLIVGNNYNWGDDSWVTIDQNDLIIYEMHVRDMTAHSSSGSSIPGTYRGLIDPEQKGGIAHIKEMGVNAVQILPAQDFANVEVPYKDKSAPIYNTWNPYARNHWGYMTTFFFAPETYYGTDGANTPGVWNGIDGRAVSEFKDMVKAFHRENIAVIMDVVYNHVSNYDYHPFKYIDREMYFRLNPKGNYIAHSGCGNDTKTEHSAMRKLILESVKYWMTEYHVDGFRFDLGNLIDPVTRELIISELKTLNPNVIILAEPWGNGYDPAGFSDMGWASFNDQFRNGVKGQNPIDGLGFIFGSWQGNNSQKSLQRYVTGSLTQSGGQYMNVAHSVNYLESHDDHSLGDFIRIGSGQVDENDRISDRLENSLVENDQLTLNKLAALFLLTSQGTTFLHAGQEWARSKVISDTNVPDKKIGKIDHNSYEKDNETNWLNWDEKELNEELVSYYKGLIQIRKNYPEFRHSEPEDYEFVNLGKKIAVAYALDNNIFVAMNGDYKKSLKLNLPVGNWHVLADAERIDLEGERTLSQKVSLPPTSGMILIKSGSVKNR